MNSAIIISILIGTVAVFQGTVNRMAGEDVGLSAALNFNNLVVLALGILFYSTAKFYPQLFPEFIRPHWDTTKLRWWFVLPGVFGFFIIAGLPYAIHKIGTFKVFLLIVVAQVVVSLFWDHFQEGIPITITRALAGVVAIISILILKI